MSLTGSDVILLPVDCAVRFFPDSTKAQDFPGPSTSFMDYMVAGARFELATVGV